VNDDLHRLIAAMRAYDAVMARQTCPDCGASWTGDYQTCDWCEDAARRQLEDERQAILHPEWMVDQGRRFHELDPIDQRLWCETRGIPVSDGPRKFWVRRLHRAVASGVVTMHESDLALRRFEQWQGRLEDRTEGEQAA
jgi:hypothetical protein